MADKKVGNLVLGVQAKTVGFEGAVGSVAKLGLAFDGLQRITKAAMGPITDVTKAFEKQQNANILLKAALQSTGQYSKKTYKDLEEYAQHLQKITTVGDEVSESVMQIGLNMGLSANELKTATRGAIGLSQAFGINLSSAMKYVAAGLHGNYSLLGRFLPQLQGLKDKSKQAAIFQRALASSFDIAKSKTNTLQGAMEQMQNALGDLKEKVGGVYAQAMIPFIKQLKNLFEIFQKLPKPIMQATVAITTFLSAIVVGQMVGFFKALSAIPAVLTAIKGAAIKAATAISGLTATAALSLAGFTALGAELGAIVVYYIKMKKAILGAEEAQETYNNSFKKAIKNLAKNIRELKKESVEQIAAQKGGLDKVRSVEKGILALISEYISKGMDTSGLRKQLAYWKSIDSKVEKVIDSQKKMGKEEKKNANNEKKFLELLEKQKSVIDGNTRSIHEYTSSLEYAKLVAYKPDSGDFMAQVGVDTTNALSALQSFKDNFPLVYAEITHGIGKFTRLAFTNMGKVLRGAKTITLEQENQINDIVKNTTGDLKTSYKLTYEEMEREYRQHTGHMLSITKDEYRGIQETMKQAVDGMTVDWQKFWEKVKKWLEQLAIKLGIEAAIAAAISALSSGTISFGAAFGAVSTAAGDMGFAEGGYIPATPGGRVVTVAEGGEGEYIIPESKMPSNVTVVVNTADPATTVEFYKGLSYTHRNDIYKTLKEAAL